MARQTANAHGLSCNAAGYFRRYHGMQRLDGGAVKPLHVCYSRDLAEARWMDAIWTRQRAKLAAAAGVTVTRFVWPSKLADELRGLVAELVRLEREKIELANARIRHERELSILMRLNDRMDVRDAYAAAGFPMPPMVESLPHVLASEVEASPSISASMAADASAAGMIEGVPAGQTFGDALTAYVESVKGDATKSDATKKTSVQRTAGLRLYASKMTPPLDLTRSMASITYGDLEALTNFVKSRPVSAKTGERITPHGVTTNLQRWREAIDWIDRNETRFGWVWPRRGVDLFSVPLTKLMSKAERDAHANGDGVVVPTAIELKAFLDGANDYQRMLILTGVFAAQGQNELASLRRDEFTLDAAKLKHRRTKTGVEGVYFLPPELVTLIEAYFAKVSPDAEGRAFLTKLRTALVTEKSDSVRQWWDDLRTAVVAAHPEVRASITFYDLRRVLANHPEIVRAGLGAAMLAQTHKSVDRKHYSPDRKVEQADVWAISQRFYAELKAAGVFDFALVPV